MFIPREIATPPGGWNAENPHDTPNDIDYYTWGLNGVDQKWNFMFSYSLWITSGIIVLILLMIRVYFDLAKHVRLLVTAPTDNSARSQRYWATPSQFAWKLKRHLLYAPIWKNRHNTEIQLSSAINIGTLPTRLHFIVLVIYIASNLVYCTLLLDYSRPKKELVAEFRGRTGVMAVVNMIPLFLLAGRNNILISLLKISFDTYNIIHRCLGRLIVLESIAHTSAWLINKVDAMGWVGVKDTLRTSSFILYGSIAVSCFILILFQTPSAIRHAFYETFLAIHIILAATICVCVWMHLQIDGLPQLLYLQIAIALWILDRTVRLAKLIYRNISSQNMTKVKVEALDGEACRVTFQMPRPWKFRPGQHVYIYLPFISHHQSHPFSLAWSTENLVQEVEHKLQDEGIPLEAIPQIEEKQDICLGPTATQMSLIVARRSGMTMSLYDKANAAPNRTMFLKGAIEGPYGGMHQLESYGTALLFAGGVGITHQVGYVRELIRGYELGTCATRKITLIWSVKTIEQVKWIEPYMREILAMEKRRDILKVIVYITRPKADITQVSPTGSVELRPGRPNFDKILDTEIEESIGTVVATVCGPGPLQDGVRNAVRKQLHKVSIDFLEESFTW